MTYIIFLIRKWTIRALIGTGIIFVGTACSNSNNEKTSSINEKLESSHSLKKGLKRVDKKRGKKDLEIRKLDDKIDKNKLELDKRIKKKTVEDPVETVYGPPPTSDDKDTQVKKK